jgi:hypothetical protein
MDITLPQDLCPIHQANDQLSIQIFEEDFEAVHEEPRVVDVEKDLVVDVETSFVETPIAFKRQD